MSDPTTVLIIGLLSPIASVIVGVCALVGVLKSTSKRESSEDKRRSDDRADERERHWLDRKQNNYVEFLSRTAELQRICENIENGEKDVSEDRSTDVLDRVRTLNEEARLFAPDFVRKEMTAVANASANILHATRDRRQGEIGGLDRTEQQGRVEAAQQAWRVFKEHREALIEQAAVDLGRP